jgi:uncharacterized iron-regulated membrane protein
LQRKSERSAKPPGGPIATFLHLWLGLTLGAVLVMAGLTGSYLAFYTQIETAAIPALRASPGAKPASLEALYGALTKVGPEKQGAWNIEVPQQGGVITARYSNRGQPQRMVSVDPVSLAVVRDVEWGRTVGTWLYELHYRLLMGRTGATIMGWLTVIMLVAVVTGVILWWRLGRSRAGRFTFDLKGLSPRHLYDQHRLLGLVTTVFLTIVLTTAVMMTLSKQVRPMLAAVSPITAQQKPQSKPLPGAARISIDRAVAIASARMPNAALTWVQVPNRPKGVFAVRFRQPGEPSRRFPRTYVWVDQFSGQVLGVQDGLSGTASDKILMWLYPLHGGEAFGVVGRIFIVLLGFAPAVLYVTGFVRWRQKARLKARRTAAAPAPPRGTLTPASSHPSS